MIDVPKASLLQIRSKTIEVNVMYATNTKFKVDGPIEVKYLGFLVTTAIPAGANTLKFRFTSLGGTVQDLCGVTDTASASKMQLFLVKNLIQSKLNIFM